MAIANGRLPASMLASIPSRSGTAYLRKDAAAALNLENFRLRARGDSWGVRANGPISGYRNYAGQVQMRAYWCGQGKCGNAAVPGTSNHGWGIALDSDDAWKLDGHGGIFDKRYSDAPWESWHRKANLSQTSYTPPKPPWKPKAKFPVVKAGRRVAKHAPTIKRIQRLLRENGRSIKVDGDFGPKTKAAVKAFKKNHGLPGNAVVGHKTWKTLRREALQKKRRK